MKIYIVGGAVRDELLDKKPNDMDYCVLAKSYKEMKDWLLKSDFTIFQEREEYMCIKAKFPHGSKHKVGDFTLCRKDGFYSDHRRPDNVEVGTLFDDLARRDFTINAIAKDTETGELSDPFHGQKDLDAKIIRCVNSSYDRFHEDPLRLIRALRFAVQLNFTLHKDIIECLNNPELYKMLDKISVERKMIELNKMFKANTVEAFKILKTLPDEFYNHIFKNNEIWIQSTNKQK